MRKLIAAFAAVVLAAGPAVAQEEGHDAAALLDIYEADVFQHEVIAMGKPVLDGAESGEAAAGDAALQQALSYDPSPEVEQRTREKLLASLLESTEDQDAEAQIRRTFAGDGVWRQFYRVLSQAGLSTTNLADVTTAFYIIAWEVVNAPEGAVDASALRAVHEDVVAALAAEPRLEDLTDAEKQEASSIMAYMATIAAASANQLRSDGDQAGLKTLQDEVHKAVLGQGLDLARLQLTDRGFAAR